MLNKFFILLFSSFLFLNNIYAQDLPTSFASISGKGLETTTGGAGGNEIKVESLAQLYSYAGSNNKYIIYIEGILESENCKTIKVGSNTTIIGLGSDATLKNVELQMVDKQNIIIRNLTIRDSYVEGDWDGKTNDFDGIQADNTHHLWIDHCHFTHLGDGLIDLRKVTDYVTVSYCKLSDHNKAFGIGWTDESDFRIGIHHCWIDNTNQRNPSFDMGIGHLYNNYLNNIASYGNQSRGTGRIIVENSVFENTKDPLSFRDEGQLYARNNQFISCSGSMIGNLSEPTKDIKISSYYEYDLDPLDQVKAIVMAEAGPQQSVSDQYTKTNNDKALKSKEYITFDLDQQNKILSFQATKILELKVDIYTTQGKLIRSNQLTLNNGSSISISDIQAGLYILKIESKNYKTTQHFMVQ